MAVVFAKTDETVFCVIKSSPSGWFWNTVCSQSKPESNTATAVCLPVNLSPVEDTAEEELNIPVGYTSTGFTMPDASVPSMAVGRLNVSDKMV